MWNRALDPLLVPLTAGFFFLPPERFSAAVFFGLMTPGLPRIHRMRLGAFMGGMTDVMCAPIARFIEGAGGEVRGAGIERLMVEEGRVTGVVAGDQTVEARHPRTWAPRLPSRPGDARPRPGAAGDYTRQRFVATMEGAVISGRKAAAAVQSDVAASGDG